MTWLMLTTAIVAEVIATTSLKSSAGFSRLWPSVIVVIGYAISFLLLAKVLESGMAIGMVYAVWSAAGVFLVAVLGFVFFRERLSAVQIVGLVLIVGGVIALEVGGHSDGTDVTGAHSAETGDHT